MTIKFEQALEETQTTKRHLLLGNGFSIALFPDRFHYRALLDQVDFAELPEVRDAFELLGTTDFETVSQALRQAATLLPLYSADQDARNLLVRHSEALKEQLVQAIAGQHPERPGDVEDRQYIACRNFIRHFLGSNRIIQPDGRRRDLRGNIYTLNYDLLLYWTLLHDDPAEVFEDPNEADQIDHDDGFRAPDDAPDAPYVTWEAEGAADGQRIHYLHGALHLFDVGPDIQKLCWERAGGVPLVEQIRDALAQNRFPLFVSEGDSAAKLSRIRHSGYLQRSLKSFAQVCRTEGSSIFIFGHSLAENDDHVLRFIERGKVGRLYVSLFGDPETADNRQVQLRASAIANARNERYPLRVSFFDAASAQIWG